MSQRVLALIALVAGFSAGCVSSRPLDPRVVADQLRERTGAVSRLPGLEAPDSSLPPGVNLQDGLTQDEAVAIALWNNADFLLSVSDLGFARVDLLEAGLLRNPVLSLLFPVGPKQLEATLRWPVEYLWERPRRIAAARLAADVTAERLVQTGLDLVALVKIAHADEALARDRQRLAEESAAQWQRIEEIARSRLAAGDISELEARASQIDAARTRQDAIRASHDVNIARERLRGLLGFAVQGPQFEIATDTAAVDCGPLDDLMREALISRPDVRAAELGVEAAGARLGWERSRILALTAVLDANGSGSQGFELGPGVEVGIPLFDRNQGGRARATAELERASRAYTAAQQRVGLELREASAQLAQARESQMSWRTSIIAPLQENVAAAERSFEAGDTSYLFVLENTRRLTEARVREREIDGDLQRVRARIERAVGRGCGQQRRELTRGY